MNSERKLKQADNEYTGMQHIADGKGHWMIIKITHNLVFNILVARLLET